MPGFICPYQDATYALHDYCHPQEAKELFNHRHSLLRSTTDRIFAALKERFPILMSVPPYPLQTQVKLVVATCALHNYIRREKPDDFIFKMYDQENGLQMNDTFPPVEMEQPMMPIENQISGFDFESEQLDSSLRLRDSIAAEIWNDYISDFSTGV